MFSNIRKRLTYTNVALTLALVFVMTGGAYAAKKYIITSTKQISPTVLKQLQGKAGQAGAPGAQGPAGTVGPAGTNGTNGTNGANGANGAQGSTGPSGVTGSPGAMGATGATGGQGIPGKEGKLGPTGATGVAGATGVTGPEGVCSTAKCTLPSGVTETGVVSAAGMPDTSPSFGAHGAITAGVSFAVPLDKAPKTHVIQFGEGEGEAKANLPAGCKGNVNEPKAESGNLCVFIGKSTENAIFFIAVPVESNEGGGEPGKTGALVAAFAAASEGESLQGTWAVTG